MKFEIYSDTTQKHHTMQPLDFTDEDLMCEECLFQFDIYTMLKQIVDNHQPMIAVKPEKKDPKLKVEFDQDGYEFDLEQYELGWATSSVDCPRCGKNSWGFDIYMKKDPIEVEYVERGVSF